MSPSSDIGVVPVRDGDGNVVSYTIRNRSDPETGGDRGAWVASSRSAETGTVPEPTPLVALKAYTRARVKSRRRMAEEDGVLVGGVIYDTSDDAHLRLMTLLMFASRDPDYTASILIRDGTVRQLNALEIYSVGIAIANHMQACALWEIEQLQAVDDATTSEELVTIESTIDSSAPAGDEVEPAVPSGTEAPPAYDDATFQKITCDSIVASENVQVGGTLAVTGATTMQSTLDVADSVSMQSSLGVGGELSVASVVNMLSTLTVESDTLLKGTLTAGQDAQLQADLNVAGTSTLAGELSVTGKATLLDAAEVRGSMTVAQAAVLNDTLSVAGATTIDGVLAVQSNASVAADLSVVGNVAVDGTLTAKQATALEDTLAVAGAADMASTLSVTGNTLLNASLEVQAATLLHSTLGVDSDATIAGKLSVSQESTFTGDVSVTSNVNVTGSIDVTEDAVIERVYARDNLARGSMFVDRDVSARTEAWVVAGSFLWRRGDRQPTGATIAVSLSSRQAKAAVALYEKGRNQVIGYGVSARAGDELVTIPIQDTVFTANDDTVFQVELYLSNATEIGRVSLSNFLLSVA